MSDNWNLLYHINQCNERAADLAAKTRVDVKEKGFKFNEQGRLVKCTN